MGHFGVPTYKSLAHGLLHCVIFELLCDLTVQYVQMAYMYSAKQNHAISQRETYLEAKP